ncbi:hypothetical protein H8S90_03785 [Olivibacter sp. SDN3]|uniref:hypothetical protein n=1 Tax=Olivibacter sp. SDN3 TaxID=2764720 RepID=UPI0016519B26|nr:hypothetical protein [Olivibacter sp. SDN3]QNL50730.1 hypothetical protein H8S90_03785 [Olivibacter sp. SDN3]
MKFQDLNNDELMETNGGFLFGSNDSSGSGGIGLGLGIDNLLSFSSERHDGDRSSKTSFSLGNGIGAALEGGFGFMNR